MKINIFISERMLIKRSTNLKLPQSCVFVNKIDSYRTIAVDLKIFLLRPSLDEIFARGAEVYEVVDTLN